MVSTADKTQIGGVHASDERRGEKTQLLLDDNPVRLAHTRSP
jgi:hypothetical protein